MNFEIEKNIFFKIQAFLKIYIFFKIQVFKKKKTFHEQKNAFFISCIIENINVIHVF